MPTDMPVLKLDVIVILPKAVSKPYSSSQK